MDRRTYRQTVWMRLCMDGNLDGWMADGWLGW